MNKQNQLSVMWISLVYALISSVVTLGEKMVSATKKKNESLQLLERFSGSERLAEYAIENNTIASCNNIGLALNLQHGNYAAGQQ